MKYTVALFLIGFNFIALYSQYSIGVGPSTFNSTNTGITRIGLNIFYEAPRNEVNTFYIRGLLTLPHKNSNDSTFLTQIAFSDDFDDDFNPFPTTSIDRITTLFAIDGGNQTYFYNNYEVGTAFYGAFHLRGIIASYQERIGPYDPEMFEPEIEPYGKTRALLMGFGGKIGAKFQLPYRGAINLDITGEIIRALSDPAFILGNEIGTVAINFNLAYRFDWY